MLYSIYSGRSLCPHSPHLHRLVGTAWTVHEHGGRGRTTCRTRARHRLMKTACLPGSYPDHLLLSLMNELGCISSYVTPDLFSDLWALALWSCPSTELDGTVCMQWQDASSVSVEQSRATFPKS